MILAIETTALCIVFFLLCFLGTGTDEKNLKNYSSYPDEVQNLINEIAEYRRSNALTSENPLPGSSSSSSCAI